MSNSIGRFDGIVRTERYFSATLLPAVLMHNGFTGLRQFVILLDAKATTERDAAGNLKPKRNHPEPDATDHANSPQIITEFHISRDLDYAGFSLDPAFKEEHLDVPDLVLIWHNRLIVCEAKFFTSFNLTTLNQQLSSQRQQVSHPLEARPELTGYLHVALLPQDLGDQLDCNAVVTWREVGDLSGSVLGDNHYVTQRIKNAVERWDESTRDSESLNYDGVDTLDDVILRCLKHGDRVEIGHIGGPGNLRMKPPEYVRQRLWKWRNPETNTGRTVRRNWIPGGTFMRAIAEVVERGDVD